VHLVSVVPVVRCSEELTTVPASGTDSPDADFVYVVILTVGLVCSGVPRSRRLWSDREVFGDIAVSLPLARAHLVDHVFRDLVVFQGFHDVVFPQVEATAGAVDACPDWSGLVSILPSKSLYAELVKVLTSHPHVSQVSRVHRFTLGCFVAMFAIPCAVLELSKLVIRLVVYRALGRHGWCWESKEIKDQIEEVFRAQIKRTVACLNHSYFYVRAQLQML
jgi:hypothetical protein